MASQLEAPANVPQTQVDRAALQLPEGVEDPLGAEPDTAVRPAPLRGATEPRRASVEMRRPFVDGGTHDKLERTRSLEIPRNALGVPIDDELERTTPLLQVPKLGPPRIETRPTAIQSSEKFERAARAAVPDLEPSTEPPAALAVSVDELGPTDLSSRSVRPETTAGKSLADVPGGDLSRVIRIEALARSGGNRGFQLVIALGMVLLGVGIFAIVALHHERPSHEALELAYPFGLSGGRLPSGRTAPPATELIFDLEGPVACGDGTCLRYRAHTADGHFETNMTMKQSDDGRWGLAP